MKLVVALILLASVGLMLIITVGGWSKLQGLKPVNLVWCILYVIIAFYVFGRWSRGLLPIAAALAILLLILAVIAATGVAGTSWFDRNNPGFARAAHAVRRKGPRPERSRRAHGDPRTGAARADRVRDGGVRAGVERRGGSAQGRGREARLQVLQPRGGRSLISSWPAGHFPTGAMHRRELGAAAHSIHELVGRQSELDECAAVALRVDRIRKVP